MGGGWRGEGEGGAQRFELYWRGLGRFGAAKATEAGSESEERRKVCPLFLARENDRERRKQSLRPRPPARGSRARVVPSFVPLSSFPLAGGRDGVGQLSPSLTPSPSAPRTTLATAFGGDLRSVDTRGDLARCSSNQVALEPFRTPASAPFGSPSARGYAGRGPRPSVGAPLRVPKRLRWTSIPARGPLRAASPCLRHLPSASLRHIEGICREALPNLAPMGFPLGRGSRLGGGCPSASFLSCSAPSADYQRARARRGDIRRQNGRGGQRLGTHVARILPRPFSALRRASRPRVDNAPAGRGVPLGRVGGGFSFCL